MVSNGNSILAVDMAAPVPKHRTSIDLLDPMAIPWGPPCGHPQSQSLTRLSPAKLSRQSKAKSLAGALEFFHPGRLQARDHRQPECNDTPSPVQHVLHDLWEERKTRKKSGKSELVSSVKCLIEKWRPQTQLSFFIQSVVLWIFMPTQVRPRFEVHSQRSCDWPCSKVIVATRKPEMHFKPAWRIKITSSVWFRFSVFDGTTWPLSASKAMTELKNPKSCQIQSEFFVQKSKPWILERVVRAPSQAYVGGLWPPTAIEHMNASLVLPFLG